MLHDARMAGLVKLQRGTGSSASGGLGPVTSKRTTTIRRFAGSAPCASPPVRSRQAALPANVRKVRSADFRSSKILHDTTMAAKRKLHCGVADRTAARPVFVGKPFVEIYDPVLSRLPNRPDPSRVLMGGVTLHADIFGGRHMGFGTALVTGYGALKGPDTADAILRSGVAPGLIVERIWRPAAGTSAAGPILKGPCSWRRRSPSPASQRTCRRCPRPAPARPAR